MSSIAGPYRLLAGLLFLTACGVAVEQAPQTSSTGTDAGVSDAGVTETAVAPDKGRAVIARQ
jgi:hypothetical protein